MWWGGVHKMRRGGRVRRGRAAGRRGGDSGGFDVTMEKVAEEAAFMAMLWAKEAAGAGGGGRGGEGAAEDGVEKVDGSV